MARRQLACEIRPRILGLAGCICPLSIVRSFCRSERLERAEVAEHAAVMFDCGSLHRRDRGASLVGVKCEGYTMEFSIESFVAYP